MYLIGFPLLLVPFAIYNIIAFLLAGVSWTEPVMRLTMISGGEWSMSPGDLLITFSLVLLFLEVVKATRIGVRSVVDHVLSLIVFLLIMVEFIVVARAATSTFFLLLVIALVDVLAGFAVTLRTAQRDLTVEGIDRVASP